MNRYQLLMAATLLAGAASANADINKCVDSEGRVTFTDTPCIALKTASAMVPATATLQDKVNIATGQPQLSGDGSSRVHGEGIVIVARDVRSPWASLPRPAPRRTVSLDAATLQAARNAMLTQDGLRRQVQVASR